MAYLATGLDLKLDALDLAGEPIDGTSEFDNQTVYEYLTEVQRKLVSGGTFGQSVLQPMDWFWARAWPRGAIQLLQPYNVTQGFAATFTAGFPTVTVDTLATGTLLPSLSGNRIFLPNVPARHFVIATNNIFSNIKSFVLREPWTGETQTTSSWLAYPDTYELPEDFVRGTSPLFAYSFPATSPATRTIDVVDPSDLERMFPQSFPWGDATVGSGMPVLAARVDDRRLRFSHFLNSPGTPFPMQVEFEYIRRPPVIGEGSIPLIPIEHRRILSYGAAFLILQNKDDGTAPEFLQSFLAQWKAMRDEQTRTMQRMSSRWGVIQPPRASGTTPVLFTETGLPVYVW